MKKLFATALMLASTTTFAAAYGTAGCGLGAVLIGDKPGWYQVFAGTSNGLSGNQTFGITTGTLNCGPGVGSVEKFISANKVSLGNDIARGEGETVESLAKMMNVKDSVAFTSLLKANYETIFQSNEASIINARITTLAADNSLI